MAALDHQVHADPEALAPDEIEAARRQITAEIAIRLAGVNTKPIQELRLPTWVRGIITAVMTNYRSGYPEGLPPGPDGERVVRQEQRRALRWFDDELALRQD